jgi:hypothetical protein
MATIPIPSPAPPSKLQNILSIINAVLQGLQLVPVLNLPIAIEQVFQGILTKALAAYQQETGQPIDLTKIPLETPVA